MTGPRTTPDGRDTRSLNVSQLLASEPVSPTDAIRLPGLVTRAFSYPRFLSIGSIDNTVEVRMSRELYDQIRAILGKPVGE